MTSTYSVPTISCNHCKQSIEGAVSKVDGVDAVVVDIEARSVRVEGVAPESKVRTAIEEAGYEVAGAAST